MATFTPVRSPRHSSTPVPSPSPSGTSFSSLSQQIMFPASEESFPPPKTIELSVNDNLVKVPSNATVLDACRLAGYYVPALCHHPGLLPVGECGLCSVEIEGLIGPVLACATPVAAGLRIHTDSPQCRAQTAKAISLIAKKTRDRFPELPGNSSELNTVVSHSTKGLQDESLLALRVDMSQCVECTRCVRVCREVVGLEVWKVDPTQPFPVVPTTGHLLADTSCVSCGQCSLVCPSGAIQETSSFDAITAAVKSGKIMIASVPSSVCIALSEEYKQPPGAISAGKIVMALKRCGFHFVFNSDFAGDLSIMELGAEMAARITSGKGPFPCVVSNCYCASEYLIKYYPQLVSNISTCKPTEAMMGALIKTIFAEKIGKSAEEIFHVALSSCTGLKEMLKNLDKAAVRDIDYAMTTRECAKFLNLNGGPFFDADLPFDFPFSCASVAGSLLSAPGGLLEAFIRTAADKIAGAAFITPEMLKCRGFCDIKTTDVYVAGQKIRIGAVNGIAHTDKFLNEVIQGGGFHLVEICGCRNGCISGGGQPLTLDPDIHRKRCSILYEMDSQKQNVIHRAHENVAVTDIYKNIGKPNGFNAQQLLHFSLKPRSEHAHIPVVQYLQKYKHGETILILHAGGVTEFIAFNVCDRLRRQNKSATVQKMDCFDTADIATFSAVLVVVNSFGDAESSAQDSFSNNLRILKTGHIKRTPISTFDCAASLGYTDVARILESKLVELGALSMIPLESTVDCWVNSICKWLGIGAKRSSIYRVMLAFEETRPLPLPFGSVACKVLRNTLITSLSSELQVRTLEFDIKNSGTVKFLSIIKTKGLAYSPTDFLTMLPPNPQEQILQFLQFYGLNNSAVVAIQSQDGRPVGHIPPSISIAHLFERYVDILSLSNPSFLRELAAFASKDTERAHLEQLADGTVPSNQSFLQVLYDHPSAHPTLDVLLEILPPLHPKKYVITSSAKLESRKCQIVVAYEAKKIAGKVTDLSNWEYHIREGDEIPLGFCTGALSPGVESPLVMLVIGIARARAIFQERLAYKNTGKPINAALLLSISTNKDKEMLYQEDFALLKEKGVISAHLSTMAPQDLLSRSELIDTFVDQYREQIWQVISMDNANFYFCGFGPWTISAKAETAIKAACSSAGKITPDESDQLIKRMKIEKRWQVEVV